MRAACGVLAHCAPASGGLLGVAVLEPKQAANMISLVFHHTPIPPSRQPHRVRMAHNLIVNYGLYRDLEVFVRGGHGEEMGRAGVVAVCCAQVAGKVG
jgi:hypothetical protein